jgi:DNA-binding transcriptional LysR family regulator
MINLPLRHILTLVCLAETGSFRRAAEQLKLSQPAVSAHIRDLESHFGVSLVHRTTRRVTMTAEGTALAARARRAFQELEMASQDLRDLAAVHRGRVVVACIPPMMASILPNVVLRLAKDFPAVDVEIRDVLSHQVEQLVDRGDADFGIGPQPKFTELAFNPRFRDYFVAAIPEHHALADRNPIAFEEVLKYPLITMTADANARLIFEQFAQRLGYSLKPRFEVVHNFSVGRLVAVGLGLTVLPRTAIPSLGGGELRIADIRSPRIFRDIGVMWRPRYRPSPSARAFIMILDDVIAADRAVGEAVHRAGKLRTVRR